MLTFEFQNAYNDFEKWQKMLNMLDIWENGKEFSQFLLNFPGSLNSYIMQKWRFNMSNKRNK